MNKIYLILSFGILWSCTSKKSNELVGDWYHFENHQLQEILIFKEDSFSTSFDNFYEARLYKTRNDTLFFQSDQGIGKMKYKIAGDTLLLFYLKSDTDSLKYIKCDSNRILDIWNSQLELSVDIPKFNSNPFNWQHGDNTILLDNNSKNKLTFNGKIFNLDSNLYSKIYDTSRFSDLNRISISLFIDKEVNYSTLKSLFSELSKANLREVNFLSYDSTSKLNMVSLVLPWTQFDYPDSIKNKNIFPPPPPIDFNKKYIKNLDLITEFKANQIIVDNAEYTFEEFRKILINNLNTLNKPTLFIYFDDSLKYERYLEYIYELKMVYKLKRDQYALESFGTDNYYELKNVQREILWDLFPMRLKYIDENQLLNYKKNAL